MRVAKIDPLGEIAISLLRDAAAEMGSLYRQHGAEQSPAATNNPLGLRDLYLAAFLRGSPVGCGALRQFDSTTAEARRMYARRAARLPVTTALRAT